MHAADFVALLQLADRMQGLVHVLQRLQMTLAHVDVETLLADRELEFDVEVHGAGGLDRYFGDGVLRVLVAADDALGGNRGLAVDVDERQIREAVLVLLRLDQEINLLLVFVKEVVVGIDLVEILRFHDDADIAQAEGLGSELLEHANS